MKWTLQAIADAVGGELLGADGPVDGVQTDSRQVVPGCLFIALQGERFDAHDFLAEVKQAGAAAVLCSDVSRVPSACAAICVADTRVALGQLAAAWRARFSLPLIGVTGSNGKTTTKEMIAAILRAAYGPDVLATQGNLNNDIGLPLTLLGLHAQHRAAVIEMGMNHPGEIAYLTHIARPTAAVVTNAQRAHLEGMGDLDEVAREKGSIYDGLLPTGVAVVDLDSPFAALWQGLAVPHAVQGFTTQNVATAHVRGEIREQGLQTTLSLQQADASADITLQVPGRHNARNALAAAAVCLAAGVPLSAVREGLAGFTGVPGRLQPFALRNGTVVLNDTYNANPDSVRAGIQVLAATVGRKILVLGDMGEIGPASSRYHDEIGGYAKSQGVDLLFALGESTAQTCQAFGEGAQLFKQVETLVAALRKRLTADTTVLVKGSRFMKMERVCVALREGDAMQAGEK